MNITSYNSMKLNQRIKKQMIWIIWIITGVQVLTDSISIGSNATKYYSWLQSIQNKDKIEDKI
jgi:hypothetical protein